LWLRNGAMMIEEDDISVNVEGLQVNQDDSDDLIEHKRILVDKGQSPVRVDKFLMDKLEKVSRNKVQEALRSGAILVDDKEVKPNFKIKPGQLISLVMVSSTKDDTVIQAQAIPLDIRYEDQDLMVIYKPAGLVVHPGVGNEDGTLVNALAWYLHPDKDSLKEGDLVPRPSLVHRIDKDTTGLMVVPKNDYAASHLAKQFYDHTVDREYRALVWGTPEPEKGTVSAWLGRDPNNRFDYKVVEEGKGKHAITHYETLESLYYVSLVKCKLETGRTHQIRVHMKYIGNTLFNDKRYGGNRILKGTNFTMFRRFVDKCYDLIPRTALHAKTLGFTHPVSGERMHFDTELPSDLQAALDRWRDYLENRKNTMNELGR
jgi:23S rRNA pseudouridine1911/1915/1917 synthase